MDLYFPDHSGGRLSAIPSPFFTSQSVHQGISPTTAHSSSLCVSSHVTTNSKLHPPKHKRQVAPLCTEMRCKLKNGAIVNLFVDVNVCVYVCLFNITAFEVRDDVTDVAHVGQMSLISFRMDWLDLFAVHGTLKSLLQHHSSKASNLHPQYSLSPNSHIHT